MWKDNVATESAPTMATYSQALNKFTESASAFMEHVHHLTQARVAYEEARSASSAIRNSLDAGDQALRSLMSQLEEALNLHMNQTAPAKKGPEPVRIDADTRADGESPRGLRTFP
jgi:hypothetical protein